MAEDFNLVEADDLIAGDECFIVLTKDKGRQVILLPHKFLGTDNSGEIAILRDPTGRRTIEMRRNLYKEKQERGTDEQRNAAH